MLKIGMFLHVPVYVIVCHANSTETFGFCHSAHLLCLTRLVTSFHKFHLWDSVTKWRCYLCNWTDTPMQWQNLLLTQNVNWKMFYSNLLLVSLNLVKTMTRKTLVPNTVESLVKGLPPFQRGYIRSEEAPTDRNSIKNKKSHTIVFHSISGPLC